VPRTGILVVLLLMLGTASLFTSRYPSQHHVSRFDSKLADDEVTLAERRADLATRAGVAETVLLDQSTRDPLRALGYTTD
jgi:hypothetical protein